MVMICIFLLNFIFFATNFCSVNSIILQKKDTYISSKYLYKEICNDSEKKCLIPYLFDPHHDGQMWYLLNRVLSQKKKQKYKFLSNYLKETSEEQFNFKRVIYEKIDSGFSSTIGLQKRILSSCNVLFDKEFMCKWATKKMPYLIPHLILLNKIIEAGVPTEVIDQILIQLPLNPLIKNLYANSCKLVRTFFGHTDIISSVKYLDNKTKLLSVSYDKTIKLWDFETGTCIRTFIGHTQAVSALGINDDEKTCISGGIEGEIKVWNIETGDCIQTILSPGGMTYCVAQLNHLKQTYYVSSHDQGKIYFWTSNGDNWGVVFTTYAVPVLVFTLCLNSHLMIAVTNNHKKSATGYQIDIWDIKDIWSRKIIHRFVYEKLTSSALSSFIKNKYVFLGATKKGFKLYSPTANKIWIAKCPEEIKWILAHWKNEWNRLNALNILVDSQISSGLIFSNGKEIKIIQPPFTFKNFDIYQNFCAPLLFSLKDYFEAKQLNKSMVGSYINTEAIIKNVVTFNTQPGIN
jgi:WD40 repeat protein